MIKNYKKLIITFVLGTVLFLPLVCNAVSISDTIRGITNQAGLPSGAGDGPLDAPLTYRIGLVINGILTFIGMLFFILILYGGALWMTAGGNDEQVAKAKKLITRSVIGIAVILAAYALTRTVLYVLLRTSQTPF